jgi:hypothetical protein
MPHGQEKQSPLRAVWRMSKTATIRTRIEPSLKSEVEEILARWG